MDRELWRLNTTSFLQVSIKHKPNNKFVHDFVFVHEHKQNKHISFWLLLTFIYFNVFRVWTTLFFKKLSSTTLDRNLSIFYYLLFLILPFFVWWKYFMMIHSRLSIIFWKWLVEGTQIKVFVTCLVGLVSQLVVKIKNKAVKMKYKKNMYLFYPINQ